LSWSQRDIGIFDEDVRTPGRLIGAILDAMLIGAGAVLLSHASLREQAAVDRETSRPRC
jgi:hypothetical protein